MFTYVLPVISTALKGLYLRTLFERQRLMHYNSSSYRGLCLLGMSVLDTSWLCFNSPYHQGLYLTLDIQFVSIASLYGGLYLLLSSPDGENNPEQFQSSTPQIPCHTSVLRVALR